MPRMRGSRTGAWLRVLRWVVAALVLAVVAPPASAASLRADDVVLVGSDSPTQANPSVSGRPRSASSTPSDVVQAPFATTTTRTARSRVRIFAQAPLYLIHRRLLR